MASRRTLLLGLVASAALAAGGAQAQDFPAKPVTIVVPFSAGGPIDVEARLLAQAMEKKWGKPVVVDNRPGAGGLIATEYVVRATPDGYTLLFTSATLAAFKVLYKELRFDPLKDLAPVSMVIDFPGGFVTNAQTPARTIEEMTALIKSGAGKINYGSLGKNTTMLLFEQYAREIGGKMTEVPYPGTAPATTALLRNDVQLANLTLNQATKAQVDAGTLRPLLAIGSRRARAFPDVPTAGERGLNIPNNGWSGLMAPAGTPKPVIDKVAAEVARYVASPEAQKHAQDTGVDKVSTTPEQLRALIEKDSKTWADLAQAIGLKPE